VSGARAVTAGSQTLVVLTLTAIYAVCFVAIKAGLPFAPPLLFAGLRALLGGLGLLVLIVALRRPLLPARREWPGVLAVALSATTIAFGAMFLSPGRTGAGIASVLGNMQPLIVVVLAALFLGEAITRGKAVTLTLGLLGVALIASPALAGPDAYGISGPLLALAASGGQAVGSVVVKRMGTAPDVLALTTWQLILGSLPLLALSALVERDAGVSWTAGFVGLLLFLALIGTSLATAVWYWLVRRGEVGQLSLFFFLIPVIGLGLAAVLFGERVSPLEGAGVVLTLAGIGVLAWESWRGGEQPGRPGKASALPADAAAPGTVGDILRNSSACPQSPIRQPRKE
jgi:drug/metabolite transporter (DMT)-like permease